MKAQEGDHKKINKKLEEINLQMLLVEIQTQTIYQMRSQHHLRKKIQFLSPNKGKQIRAKHQQEATPKLTTLKRNRQNNKQKKLKNLRKK